MKNTKMQELIDDVIENVEGYLENYDWDGAFKKYLENI